MGNTFIKKPVAKNESVSPINVQSSPQKSTTIAPVSNPLPVQQKPQQPKKKGLFDDDDDADDFLSKKPQTTQKTAVQAPQPVMQAKK